MNVLNPQLTNLSMQYEDFYARGQYANALEVAQKLLELAQISHRNKEKMDAYLKLMHSYYSLGEVENAFELIVPFRILCEENRSLKTDYYLHLIRGYIYEYEENYTLAVNAVEIALTLALKLNENLPIATSRNLYSHYLLLNGENEKAHLSALESYHFIQKNMFSNLLYVCHSQHILATTYIDTGQLQNANQILVELASNPIIVHNKKERSRYLFAYATYYMKLLQYEKAIMYFKGAEEIAFQNNDYILLKRIYKLYAQVCALQQDYKQAFSHMQNYTHLLEQTIKTHFISKTQELDIKQNAFVVEKRANIDTLSGLYNRSYLEKTTNQWLSTAKKDGNHICCIVFDVDNFKTINDTYGHLFGDEVIKHIGKCCAQMFSTPNCICARFGGDEFVIILLNYGRDKIRPATQELFKKITCEKILFEQKAFNITISMGVVCNDSFPSKRFTQLFRVADQALYMAKRQGKNQILAMTNSCCSL